MEVRLTVRLPRGLIRHAKALAALRGETVSAFVQDALKEYIPEAEEEIEDIRAVDEVEARIAAGTEALHSLEEVEAELDALDEEETHAGIA